MSTDLSRDFYRQFEDRFRGSRSVIKDRLAVYKPFLASLRAAVKQNAALDLGCGRGEWLELLVQTGFQARGVDLDDGMLQACHALGLPVARADALQTLKSQPDNSLALLSALHVVEHIPFAELLELVHEAHRALAPGGLLILETPNSENLYNTTSFYLDPTHSKPIPQALLSFVVEFGGFKTNKVMGLNEADAQQDSGSISLAKVIFSASPDYAVIGIKGDKAAIAPYQALLDRDYGVSLLELCRQYDQSGSEAGSVKRLEKALDIVSDRYFATGCELDDTHALAAQNTKTVALLLDSLSQLQNSVQSLSDENEKLRVQVHDNVNQLQNSVQSLSDENEKLRGQLHDNVSELQNSIHGLRIENEELRAEYSRLVERIDDMSKRMSGVLGRVIRIVGRIRRSVKEHGLRGFIRPFGEYVRAKPARRVKTAKWLRRFGFRKAAKRLEQTESQPCQGD